MKSLRRFFTRLFNLAADGHKTVPVSQGNRKLTTTHPFSKL